MISIINIKQTQSFLDYNSINNNYQNQIKGCNEF